MIINLKNFSTGKQILVKRTVENIAQKDLAKALGITVTSLSKIEQGKMPVPKKHQEAINDYINSYLITEITE